MHPELIPGWPLHSYGLMLVVAFYSAYFLSRWTARKESIDPNRMLDILLIGAVLGIVGARAMYVIRYKDQIRGFIDLIAIWNGGLVFYGGLVTATIGLAIYIRRHKLPFWKLADAAAPCATRNSRSPCASRSLCRRPPRAGADARSRSAFPFRTTADGTRSMWATPRQRSSRTRT